MHTQSSQVRQAGPVAQRLAAPQPQPEPQPLAVPLDPVAMSAGAAHHSARLPRVLMVVESSGGGTGRHVLDLSEGLLARGCDVHVMYSTGRIDRMFADRLAGMRGLRSVALPMRTTIHPSDFAAVDAGRRYAHQHGPFDVLHGHSSKGGAIARLIALGTPAAAFYTLHGLIMMDPGLARWKRMFYLGIELMLARRTARVIAVAPEEARAAIRMGFGRHRVAMIPNGVDEPRLAPRADARRAIGVADDAVVVGFVGRLVEQKAPHMLIEAFAATRQKAPNAVLALVGGGPLLQPLRELATRLGVGRQVLFLGERDPRGVLAAFDLFALSSRKEGLPYVILEAMAAGLPIVATETSGVEILIEQGVNGLAVAPDDVGAFAAALTTIVTDPQLLARYGRASRAMAGRFTIDAMVDRTLAAYRAALAE